MKALRQAVEEEYNYKVHGIKSPHHVDRERASRRTVAELVSLPAICPLRRCRRYRQCGGDEPVCLQTFQKLAAERVDVLLGWQPEKIPRGW